MRWAEDNDSQIPAGSVFLLSRRKTDQEKDSGKKREETERMNNRCGGGKKRWNPVTLRLLPLSVPAWHFTCPPNERNDRFLHLHQWQIYRSFSEITRGHVCVDTGFKRDVCFFIALCVMVLFTIYAALIIFYYWLSSDHLCNRLSLQLWGHLTTLPAAKL